MAKHNKIGVIGEGVAEKYLKNKGFFVLDRNYRKKWGELDIVVEKNSVVHFIEVKTVSRKSYGGKFEQEINNYRPEDNMHPWKLQRLRRAIQTYLLEKYRVSDPKWQFDLICVFLDYEKQVAKVKFIENLIL
ncbi:MAG: YraN family protein [Candidatus Zambryskibacteria bacterium]|nr:YraN family protein [Candidatus Zambryskibacteria bacterium]